MRFYMGLDNIKKLKMNVFKKIIIVSLLTIFASSDSIGQTPITVCPQLNSFTGMTRGYHFTAPTNFTICGIYVEDDMSTLFQSVAIVRFTAGPPPAYAGTTNAFVTLFQNLNYGPNNMITVPNVAVNTGDIIGIYGSRGANSINSYGSPNCGLTIGGFPTTAQRSGMQFDLAAGPGMHDIWSEVNYNIGRVTMYTNCCVGPIAIPAVTGDTSVCEGDVSTYTVPAQTNALGYNWTVPGGATITSGQGTTSITVTWNNAPGGQVCVDWTDSCSVSPQTCLNVVVNPTPVAVVPTNIISCHGDLVPASAFTSTPVGGTFTWTSSNPAIGLGASGIGNTPAFTGTNPGTSPISSTISVIPTLNGCVGLPATYTITIDPIVSTSTNVSICQGDSMLIGGNYYSTQGAYIDTLGSANGCDSIVTYNLSINIVSVATSNVSICEGDSILLNGNYYSSAGQYPFTFTSSFGCDSTIIYDLSLAPLPIFNVIGGGLIHLGESANLAVMPGVSGTTYSWSPPIWLSCYTCQNPIATPQTSTWYYVTVKNAGGCERIDSVYIEVDPTTNIYVPNIFSPNDDNNNDVYLISGKGIDQFNLAIFNRWGQLLFESTDIEQGWDGTKEGTPLGQGVFVYKLNVIFYDGETIEQTGNITLIR